LASPLHQFQIEKLISITPGGADLSFTNSSLAMVGAVAVTTLFLTLGMRHRGLVPGRWQSAAELAYEFVANMVRDNVGNAGRKFFPFVFSIFMFILLGNLIGLLPYSFTFTSHIVVTATLALIVVGGATIAGIIKHGLHFFSFFIPKGVPIALMPLMVPIEIISYLSRPVSLSIRLFANMMAGHTMLKVFGGFVLVLGFLGGWAPLVMDVLLIGFEFLVAVLQAYVFAVLTCIYLNDALNLH
jgi:F-type H+-transporting ATPase subunit a